MKKYKWMIILINLMLVLVIFNFSVFKKEDLLKNGKLILLELAPVDPRSLMQGDYMDLSYAISQNEITDGISKRGFVVVKTNQKGIAHKVRVQDDITPLNPDELLIEYTLGNWGQMNIGTEAFFFQEGDAEKYENAKYGGVTVDDKGNSLLMGLYDENLNKIE